MLSAQRPTPVELVALRHVASLPAEPSLLSCISRLSPFRAASDPKLPETVLATLSSPLAHPRCHAALLLLSERPSFAGLRPAAAAAVASAPPAAAAAALAAAPAAAAPALKRLLARADAEAAWAPSEVAALGDAVVAVVSACPAAALAVDAQPGDEVVRMVAAVAVLYAWQARQPAAGLALLWGNEEGKRVEWHVRELTRAVGAECEARLCGQAPAGLPDQLLLGVAAVIDVVAGQCGGEGRARLAQAFVEAIPRLGSSALALGVAVAKVGRAADVVVSLHQLACDVGVGTATPQRGRLLVGTLSTLAVSPFRDQLTAADALVALDGLALLSMPMSFPAHPALALLASRIASDPHVLARLGELASSTMTPPQAPLPRLVLLLYALVLSLSLASPSRESTTRCESEGVRDKRASGGSTIAYSWLRTAALLREQYMHGSSPRTVLDSVALDACIGMVASVACDQHVSSTVGTTLWNDVLALFEKSSIRATDLARALDVIVSGAMTASDVTACLRQLVSAAHQWTQTDMRRVAVILALRATLRCELPLLRGVLDILEALVVREDAVEMARDAVLSADAVRKATMLNWYFRLVNEKRDAPRPGRFVAKL